MSGWFHALDVMDNIAIFASFVVLPLLLIVCEIGDDFERQKAKEQQIRYELRKEERREAEIETKKEKEGEKNEN